MDKKLLRYAHKIAYLSTQIEIVGLVEGGFIPVEHAQDACLDQLQNGPVNAVEIAHEILGEDLSDNLSLGILLKDTLHGLAEESIAEDSEDYEALPEKIEDLVDRLKDMIEQLKGSDSKIDALLSEIYDIHRQDEDFNSDEYDDFDFEDALNAASDTYRQMHIIGYIQDLQRAHNAISNLEINEYTNVPLDEMSIDLYFDEFQAAQPLPTKINTCFAQAFNAASSSHDYGQTMVKKKDGSFALAVQLQTATNNSGYNNRRRPGNGGFNF